MARADRIYGVLLTSIRDYIIKDNTDAAHPKRGLEVWRQICGKAGISSVKDFYNHGKYPKDFITCVGKAHSEVLPESFPHVEDSMKYFGECFVKFCQESGYSLILQVAGRHFMDFLLGIDNLHETMRFVYPTMCSPYFVVEQQDAQGCEMVYHSQRRGFAWYVTGQLQTCAELLYGVDVRIRIVEQVEQEKGCSVRYRLDFNNHTYRPPESFQAGSREGGGGADGGGGKGSSSRRHFPDVPGSRLFELLPFTVAFDKHLKIQRVGKGTSTLLGRRRLRGLPMMSVFTLRRPLIEFTWENVMRMRNVAFELEAPVDPRASDTAPQENTEPPLAAAHTGRPGSARPSSSRPRTEKTGGASTGSAQTTCRHSRSGQKSPEADCSSGQPDTAPASVGSGEASRPTGRTLLAPPSSCGQTKSKTPTQGQGSSGRSSSSHNIFGEISASGHSGSFLEIGADHGDPREERYSPGHTRSGNAGNPASNPGDRAPERAGCSAERRSSVECDGGDSSGSSQTRSRHSSAEDSAQSQPASSRPKAGPSLLCPFSSCAFPGPKRVHSLDEGGESGPEEASSPEPDRATRGLSLLCPFMAALTSTASVVSQDWRTSTSPTTSSSAPGGGRTSGEGVSVKVTDDTSSSGAGSSERTSSADCGEDAPSEDVPKPPPHSDLFRNGGTAESTTMEDKAGEDGERGRTEVEEEEEEATQTALLKGQMCYVLDFDLIVYIFTPHIGSLEELERQGLYISDLNMYDSSMNVVLNGFTSAPRLVHYMEKERKTSVRIQKTCDMQSRELKMRDKFLRTMLPGTVVDKLRRQEDTCEAFDMVTILFSDLVGFDSIVNAVNAHVVVQLLNYSLSIFDPIVDKHRLFKAETRGDAQYMVAGGVEGDRKGHTQRMAALALDFLSVCHLVKCPVQKTPLSLRIGIHVGNVVSGTIGTLKRQFCLFGDSVNTAARIHTSGLPGRIHLSEPCRTELEKSDYVTIFRGVIPLKGKGEMRTFWLAGRKGDPETLSKAQLFLQEQQQQLGAGATSLP